MHKLLRFLYLTPVLGLAFILLNTISKDQEPKVKNVAEKMIDDQIIDFVGSDCHHFHHLEMINHAKRLPAFHSLIQQEQILNKTL